jgi:hypothetical protein
VLPSARTFAVLISARWLTRSRCFALFGGFSLKAQTASFLAGKTAAGAKMAFAKSKIAGEWVNETAKAKVAEMDGTVGGANFWCILWGASSWCILFFWCKVLFGQISVGERFRLHDQQAGFGMGDKIRSLARIFLVVVLKLEFKIPYATCECLTETPLGTL